MAVRTLSARPRLQDLLERLAPGDEIHVRAASQETGLDPTTCQTVLEALARVDLFTQTAEHVFVRRRMFDVGAPEWLTDLDAALMRMSLPGEYA